MALESLHRLLAFLRGTTEMAGAPWRPSLPPFGTQAVFPGTSGDDTIAGTSGNDTFNMGAGGNDTVSGRKGNDVFNFGAELTALDAITGGAGDDTVRMVGNYAGGRALTFAATTMVGVETLLLSGGSFALTMDDANVADDAELTVDARAMTVGQSFTFDGSAEIGGRFEILAGAGTAFLTGGQDSDDFEMGAHFRVSDRIDGGGGDDNAMSLDGDYSDGLIFKADTIHNIRSINLAEGHSYFLTLDNGNVVFGQTLSVDGDDLGAADSVVVDGSDETSAELHLDGGAGDDTLIGGGGGDSFDPGLGNDTVIAGAGNDEITMGGGLTSGDDIDGGDGNDLVTVQGTFPVVGLSAANFRNIETLLLGAGGAYDFSLSNDALGPGQVLTVDARELLDTDTVNMNALPVTNGQLFFLGGNEDDIVTIGQSGLDVVRTGGGDDRIQTFGNLSETVRIDGGLGSEDTLVLDGNYADRLEFQSRTIRNIETITLTAGHGYNFATADGNVADGQLLLVDGTACGRLIFDGSAETNGNIHVQGGAGNDTIIVSAGSIVISGGEGNNFIDFSAGGVHSVATGSGNDVFNVGAGWISTDEVFAGAGTDTILFDGDYSASTFTLPDVEIVKLATGNTYRFAAVTAAASVMAVQATHLGANDRLTFAGSGGAFTVNAGAANDSLTGGSGHDTLVGSGGDDTLKGAGGFDLLSGGSGKDTFVYGSASDSTSITYDFIGAPNFDEDILDLPSAVSGIDAAVNTGALSNTSHAKFDSDLTSAMAAHLLANHALLFTPNAGNLSGLHFLIVDLNSTPGYQAAVDLVIEISGAVGTLSTGDFI